VEGVQHVRENFSCRCCEKITQPPAPSHPIARGRAGSGLLACWLNRSAYHLEAWLIDTIKITSQHGFTVTTSIVDSTIDLSLSLNYRRIMDA
jgi:hypothetical protein